MATKKFDKETLRDMVFGDFDPEEYKVQENEFVGTTRWSILYSLVFTELSTNKSYMTSYSVGATECQDESPFEYDDDEITCTEVYPREVTVVKWTPVQ